MADAGGQAVTVINTATNTVATTLEVGALPVKIAIIPDSGSAYVHA